MANEFIARKGLISLKSSSFEETVHVEGSLSSPVEALLTASWAVNVLNSNGGGDYFVVSTSPQNVIETGSFQEILFDTTLDASSAWNNLTCSLSGRYDITLETRMEKYAMGSGVGATRLMLNDLEISGSYHGETIPINGVGQNLFSKVITNISSGSSLRPEFASSTTNIGINTMPIIGSTNLNCSVKLTIQRI